MTKYFIEILFFLFCCEELKVLASAVVFYNSIMYAKPVYLLISKTLAVNCDLEVEDESHEHRFIFHPWHHTFPQSLNQAA